MAETLTWSGRGLKCILKLGMGTHIHMPETLTQGNYHEFEVNLWVPSEILSFKIIKPQHLEAGAD